MNLTKGSAVVLFVRRSDTEPARYMAGIRKTKSAFETSTNDLKLGAQKSLSELGEFGTPNEAVNAASERLLELLGT
jgi:hypothetical protein